MGFLGGIGKVFSSIGNAFKSIATSTIGSFVIKTAAGILGGPIGKIAADAALNLLKGNGIKGALAGAAKGIFGGLADKFGLGSIVKNLPAAVKNVIGLLKKPSLGGVLQTAGSLFSGTPLGDKIGGIVSKVSGVVGKVTGGVSAANGVLGSVQNFLSSVGLKSPNGLGNVSDVFGKVLNTGNKINDILNGITGALNPMQMNMIKA